MSTPQLTIQEFIAERNFDIDNIYVDKFWSSISDEKWIYIGNEMLSWMGYEAVNNQRALKQRYLELLNGHFAINADYKHLTATEFRDLYVSPDQYIEMPTDVNHHNRTMHIIVSPDCFKAALMLMNTDRAKQIRMYYIQLEKVFKAYMKYCNEVKDAQIVSAYEELKEAKASSDQFKMMLMKKSEYKMDQYVYVASSYNYAKKNIFKIGMTRHLEKRMTGYQTGRSLDDKFAYLYIIKCVDAKTLEQTILSRLDNFRYEDNRELVQIHFDTLISIISPYAEFERSSTIGLNSLLTNYYDTYADMPIAPFEDIVIKDLDLYIEENFGIKPIDRYVPAIETKAHPLSLTTEIVNERLAPYGIRLKEEYNGRCDIHNVFECMSVLKHTIRNSYEEIWDGRERGCVYCHKTRLLDQITIYKYDASSYEYVSKYATFDDLKNAEPTLNHQLLRNIIREERWLTPHEGHIYSILSPYEGKLDLMKPLTDAEMFVVEKLNINYTIMRDRLMQLAFNFILAIDQTSGKVYSGSSATQFSKKLTYVGSNKLINRKTIAKYLNTKKLYAGYIWMRSNLREYNGQQTISLDGMPDL